MKQPPNETLYGIQFLRFIAAMMVVMRHALHRTDLVHPGQGYADWGVGSAGVDIFFVISGFLMVQVTLDKDKSPLEFWLRRVIRVVPIYWVFTLIAFALTVAFPAYFFGSMGLRQLLASLAFIPEPLPNGKVVPVIPAGWTLNLEMPFYTLLAACLLFGRSYLIATVSILFGIFCVSTLWVKSGHIPAFYAGGAVILEFAMGIFAAFLLKHSGGSKPGLGLVMVVFGFVLIWFMWNNGPNPRALVIGGPALLIVMGTVIAEPLLRTWAPKFTILIGDASYSIYLVHMIWMNPLMRGGYNHKDGYLASMPPSVFLFILVVGSLVLGISSHLWLEKPLIARLRGQMAALSPKSLALPNTAQQ